MKDNRNTDDEINYCRICPITGKDLCESCKYN